MSEQQKSLDEKQQLDVARTVAATATSRVGGKRWQSRSGRDYYIDRGLSLLAGDVRENWRATDYPADMQGSREQFRHAHTHATKAIGKIAALIDHVDHDRLGDHEAAELLNELPKLISDLVRCAAKMAQVAPIPIDFATAYLQRAKPLAIRWQQHRERA